MLKFKYEKLDDIPEHLREYYAEKDGVYYLQAEGVVPKSRLDEFRDNNTQLMRDKKELQSQIDELGITSEELAELRAQAKKNAGKKDGLSDEEKAELVEAEVEKRVKKMKSEYDTQIETLTDSLGKSKGKVSELLIDNELRRAGSEAGIRDEAVQDVIGRGRSVFSVNDEGAVVAHDGEDVVYGKDGSTPLTISEWVTERKADAPHWFKESSGGDSKSQSKKSTSGGHNDSNLRGRSRMAAARQNG